MAAKNNMAAQFNLDLDAGADFQITFEFENSDATPIDLTGYSARMMVRRQHTSETVSLSLTSPVGGLVVSGPAGEVAVTVNKTQTAGLSSTNAVEKYVYDLEVESGAGVVTRAMEGTFIVRPQVTR